MKTFHRALIASAVLGLASPALAQTAPAPAPADPAMQAAPAPDAAPQATTPAAPVADAEISSFAKAMVAIDAVQKDATLAPEQKQEQMASKVQAAGLEPQRFNEIGQAIQGDPALQTRIQTAIQAEVNTNAAVPGTPAADEPAPGQPAQ